MGGEGPAFADLGDQAANEVEAVDTAVESLARLPVADLGLEGVELGARDVGQVGRDRVEAPGRDVDGGEQIGADEADAFGELEAIGVGLGELEGRDRGVDGDEPSLVAGLGDREGDGTRARADVEDRHQGRRRRPEGLEQPVDEVLGLGPGDQHAAVDEQVEIEGMEAARALDVGDRLAGEAAANEVAEIPAIGLGQEPVVLEIELETLAAERPGQQVFGVDAGLLDAEGGEAFARPGQQLSHRPTGAAVGLGHPGDVTCGRVLGKWDRPKIFWPRSCVLPANRVMSVDQHSDPAVSSSEPSPSDEPISTGEPSPSKRSLIEFSGVTKTYATMQRPALDELSFSIGRGEFALLMGPSGAGKSTLLQLILAMEQPDHGTIRVAGRDVHRLTRASIPYLRRNLGAVFQDFKLLPEATPLENVRLTLQVLGLRRRDVVGRAREALTRVGIDPSWRKPVRCMSGGEQQRVALARALAGRPPILLADEPTGNLDPALTRDVLRALELIRASGTTIVLATHDPLVYQHAAASRVLHLERGRLLEDRVLDRTPEFTAEFDDKGDPIDWIATVDDDEFSDEPLLVDHKPLGEVA